MKKASEIYEALWKIDEKLGVMTRTILRLGRRVENIKIMAETKEEISSLRQGATLDDAIETFSNIAIEEIADLETTVTETRKISIDALGEPEAEESDVQTERGSAEDKQKILDMFWHALKETRAGGDVAGLKDNKDGSMTIYFVSGTMKKVNIECDSGIAMIMDVCRALM